MAIEAVAQRPAQTVPADSEPAAGLAAEFTHTLASAQAAGSADGGRRLRDGVVSLSGQNGNWIGDPAGRMHGLQGFQEWLNSSQPFPGVDNVSMNCYQWVLLGGLKSGAVDRAEARTWHQGIVDARGEDAKRAAIFGDNEQRRIDVAYTQASGQWRVGRIEAPDVQPGQLISIDGAAHVMVVTGRDTEGRILVASFPTVVFGSLTDHPMSNAEPYVGTLEGFLNENLANWRVNDGGDNNFLGSKIVVGDAGFL